MGEESARVNLVAEDDDKCETEVRSGGSGQLGVEEMQEEEGTTPRGVMKPEPWREVRFATDVFTREVGSEPECLGNTHTPSSARASEEGRWWSPEPPQATSKEDEEEVQYLMHVLGLEPPGGQTSPSINSAAGKAEAGPGKDAATPGAPRRKGPTHPRGTKRRKPRGKTAKSRDREWEQTRQDAWLREMLTDTSESESEEKYGRFAESGRWITELCGVPQQAATTSRGECSGRETPDSS
jgi:hypothetical protein